MKKVFVLLALLLITNMPSGYAQKVWIFGDNIGIDFNGPTPTMLNPPPNFIASTASGACICDASGQLLFYSNGKDIYDKTYSKMPNGANIFGPVTDVTARATQASVIIPMPDSAHLYYVFSLEQINAPLVGDKGKLYYSIVDINLNSGLGDVVPGKKKVLLDSFLSPKMAPVLGDRCNVWLMLRTREGNFYKAYEITSDGINPTPVISNCGLFHFDFDYTTSTLPPLTQHINMPYLLGHIKFSPLRNKMVTPCQRVGAYTPFSQPCPPNTNGVELYDFDPVTGIVSNPLKLDTTVGYYSVCFSPDGSKLYGLTMGPNTGCQTTSIGVIYQWDLSLPNTAAIIASKTFIASTAISIKDFADMKVAPDNKIYIPTPAENFTQLRYMHVIHQPNLAGAACQFNLYGFQLYPAVWSLQTYLCLPLHGLPNEVVYYVRDTFSGVSRVDTAICFRDSARVQALDTSGWEYLWDDGQLGYSKNVTQSGRYIVTYKTKPCTFHQDTLDVAFVPPLQAGLIRNNCSDVGSVAWIGTENGDTTEYSFKWYNSSGQLVQSHTSLIADSLRNVPPGTYSVTAISNKGCDTAWTVVMPAGLHASFTGDTGACEDSPVDFQSTATGGVSSFYWDFGDGYTANIANPVHIYDTPGRYVIMFVAIDTAMGCSDTAYGVMNVDTFPQIRFITDPHELCEGKSVQLSVSYTSGIDTLIWNFGDGFMDIPGDSYINTHAFDSSGTFIITAAGKYPFCPDVDYSDTIHVYPYPVVDLGPDTNICLNGQPILLTNLQMQPGIFRYFWNTGDTTPAIYIRHHAIYALTVTSPQQCATTDSIEVFKACYIDIPNVFTPNGDGLNDYFFPRQLLSRDVSQFSMTIFNRWGEVIFETTRPNGRGWDGNYNGQAQSNGVFIYLIDVAFTNGIREHYEGNVTLMR